MRKLAGCFATWYDTIKEDIRLRNVCERVIKRMLMRQLAGCFTTWADALDESKRLKVVGQRVVQRMLQRKMAGSFFKWIAIIEETKRLRLICKRVGARWHKAGLVATLNRWRAFVSKRLQDREIVRKWLISVKNREIVSALRSWKVFVDQEIKQEEYDSLVGHEQIHLLCEFFKRRRRRVMFRCATQWRRAVVRRKLKLNNNDRSLHQVPQDISLDTLIELISQLIVKNMAAEHERARQCRLVNEAGERLERRRRQENKRSRDVAIQISKSRDSSSQTPKSSPRSSGRMLRAPVPKGKPWISGISSSPSHSKVVAEQEEFTEAYRFQQKERITQMKVKVKETKSGRGIGRRGGNRSGSVRRRPTTITAWGEDKHRSATNQNQKISPEKLRKEITQFLHSMTNHEKSEYRR
jgi:hypothetical protein